MISQAQLILIFANQLDPRQLFINKIPFIEYLEEDSSNKVCLIGLNSCLKSRAGESQGLIGYSQMCRLAEALKDDQNTQKIVYLHHIPYKPADEFYMNLLDWEDLIDVVNNKIKILAFGHEGPMEKPLVMKFRAKFAEERRMKVRRGNNQGIHVDYLLNANNSVAEQACYRIRVENSNILLPEKVILA